jgi:glycosyltransferase involved in cell wall biosynthesis
VRILHVTDCYLPRLGGIEMHVHDLVERQRRSGHDARILTSEPQSPLGTPDPGWVRRVPLAAPTALLRSVFATADLTAPLEQAGADAVHVHVSVLSPFAAAAAWRAATLGLPTVVTVHSLWSSLGVLPGLAGAALRLREWPVLWSAVSDRAAAPLRTMLGPEVPVVVLPNAVDAADWTVRQVPAGVPTIVSVMRLAPRKRPLPLARMLRQVRAGLPQQSPLRAVVIGDGPQRAPLERYLDRHAMRDWVELPGRLDRAAIREAYAGSTLYVAPALLESFGIAALEARCAGLPVVASSHGGVGEFITHGLDGALVPSDSEMVAAMVRLLTDVPYRRAVTAHTRAVVPDLGWAVACERSLASYRQAALVAAAAPRPGSRSTPLTTGVGA